MDIREQRKYDHIKEAIKNYTDYQDYFKDISLIPMSASNVKFDDVDLKTNLYGKILDAPILINAMTGGARGLEKFNEAFALVAKEHNIAMAVGSQKAGIINSDLAETFSIARKVNPEGLIFANLSALETMDTMCRAIEMISADGIQLHLNHAQELSMAEGDRDFSKILKNIEKAVRVLEIPVIVKEVGSGLSRESARIFRDIGVSNFDVGGYGGTNFPKIEDSRNNKMFSPLGEIGIPTPVSIIEVRKELPEALLFASGGLRNSNHIVKSLILGADLTGIAAYFLKIFDEKGYKGLSSKIAEMIEEVKKIFVVLGIKNLSEIKDAKYVTKNEVKEWIEQRS